MPCIKIVGAITCPYCSGSTVKYGKCNNRQRYHCKTCKRIHLNQYVYHGCRPNVSNSIAKLVTEGCGIRSIARLLNISPLTVIANIKRVAAGIEKPVAFTNRIYEVDELRTVIGNKNKPTWVIYALDKHSLTVADFVVGPRTKSNLHKIITTLRLSNCKEIFTDKLNLYRYIIPQALHRVKRYGTNHIERKNLSLRTSLKRLGRKTICYSKSAEMLAACLTILFWYSQPDVLQIGDTIINLETN